MKEFALLFRRDFETKTDQPSIEQLQESIKLWQNWIGGIAARKKLVNKGNRLHPEGKVVRSNNIITDGPYAEIKESIGGFIVIRAIDFVEAEAIAKDCPVLLHPFNGSVEIRQIISAETNV
ncbi:MAG: transcription initiation protein [Sphingobacteriia bacterium]|nr:transcription initiation protein [Sphingobacteriia bacterium]